MTVDELRRILQPKAGHWPVIFELSLNGEASYVEMEPSAIKMMEEMTDGSAIFPPGKGPEGAQLRNVVVVAIEVEVVEQPIPYELTEDGKAATMPASTTEAAPTPETPPAQPPAPEAG